MTAANIGLAGVLNTAPEIETYVSQYLSAYMTGIFKDPSGKQTGRTKGICFLLRNS